MADVPAYRPTYRRQSLFWILKWLLKRPSAALAAVVTPVEIQQWLSTKSLLAVCFKLYTYKHTYQALAYSHYIAFFFVFCFFPLSLVCTKHESSGGGGGVAVRNRPPSPTSTGLCLLISCWLAGLFAVRFISALEADGGFEAKARNRAQNRNDSGGPWRPVPTADRH